MSVLPAALGVRLAERLGAPPRKAVALGGGMVSPAARIDGAGGPLFVKWMDGAPPGFFAAEADGLARLRAGLAAAGAPLRVPDVVQFAEAEPPCPAFLVLSWVAVRPPADEARFARQLGEGLAALHRENAAPAFGLDRDNFLGSQPQPNTPSESWPAFYRDRRLEPQIARARRLGRLTPDRDRLLQALLERVEPLLDDLPAVPRLLHGDLWSGNFLSGGDGPVLIDPAVYFGEREVEMAFVELFGGFPAGFLPAYQAAFPLDSGYAFRRPLHQLYPLLVHLNHFGETYGPAVDQVCRRYAPSSPGR